MKQLLLIISLFTSINVIAQTQSIYVSNNGNDAWGGNNFFPVKTLKGAYDKITNPGNTTYNIILMDNGGPINIGPVGSAFQDSIHWRHSGSSAHPIKIYSQNCYTVLTRPTDNGLAMIYLEDVSYIHFTYVHFYKGITSSLNMSNVNQCRIEFCKFSGDGTAPPQQTGTIWLGGSCSPSITYSSNNTIANNKFYDMGLNANTFHQHGIYFSYYTSYNNIINNTIIEPPAYSIHGYHGHFYYNDVKYNLCTQKENTLDDNVRALECGVQDDVCGAHPWYTALYNNFTNNYIFDPWSTNDPPTYKDINYSNSNLPNYNPHNDNTVLTNVYPNDPYWLGYNHSNITNRMASIDLDGDNHKDDIIAFYDNGGGSTTIHSFTSSNYDRSFLYSGSAGEWSSLSYTANNVTGRVVTGDFDRDGKEDDIAAFYDYGNNTTQIHVWKYNNGTLSFAGSWWSTGGYNANMISSRIVSGDFDRDGYNDDIAAFYDNGNGNTSLHVWTSTGSSFYYHWSSGWWNISNGGYDVNKITNRVVSGDFDRDGKKDDIAAFYDNGSGNTSLHVWLSTGGSFNYQNSNGWWNITNGGYDVNKITGKIVAGDFDQDGKEDDIAAFYDNGSSSTNLHTWLSTGGSFNYQNSNGWWSSTGYDVSKITGHVVSGDFDQDGKIDDITAFYDYSNGCGNVRSNVWHSTGSNFAYANGSLGYPWWSTTQYARLAQDNPTVSEESSFVQEEVGNVTIYPNPNNGEFSLQINLLEEGKLTITLTSIDGKLSKQILNESRPKGIQLINWKSDDEISRGIYFAIIETNGYREVKKVIID